MTKFHENSFDFTGTPKRWVIAYVLGHFWLSSPKGVTRDFLRQLCEAIEMDKIIFVRFIRSPDFPSLRVLLLLGAPLQKWSVKQTESGRCLQHLVKQ